MGTAVDSDAQQSDNLLAGNAASAWLGRGLPAVAGLGLAALGITRRSPAGALLALAGGAVAYGGITHKAPLPGWVSSRFPHVDVDGRVVIKRAVTIQRQSEELYAFWRDFSNLPRFMRYLHEVRVDDNKRSHWVASGPLGTRVEWTAEIVEEQPDTLIRWQSVPGAQVPNRGEVRFQTAPTGRGTEVRLRLEYEPPAGVVGATVAQVLGQGADRQVRESLRNFKQLMEAGEIPTNDRQPMGTCREG
jgi:uncharacterized membrane protein